MLNLNRWFTVAGLAAALIMPTAHAAEITLRFHQFLPPQANVPALAIAPWIKKVETESGGRIKVQRFDAMALGGKPPELFDQAKDGVVDIVWTALGYTPGRFPRSEVFELPFISSTQAEPSSRAFYEYVRAHAADEFRDVRLIAAHVAGPGVFHSKDPIHKLEDVRGMKVRGASRIVNMMLEQLGATPVGMPAPAVGEAMSKGVISAATIQWEVVPALKLQQLVRNHTQFEGDKGLYTGTFAVVMNKASYERMPVDLRKVIDDNSGVQVSALFGRAMDAGDKTGFDAVQKAGNSVITLDAVETARWQRATSRVRGLWYQEVSTKGIDGPALAASAEALVVRYAGK
ncbi:MAG: TRAP transporter substrate-binding protein [Burkholderiaceae bacterium]|nr:TRAP transporter substrate-binding protein [Burkholderiaceae bacterium]